MRILTANSSNRVTTMRPSYLSRILRVEGHIHVGYAHIRVRVGVDDTGLRSGPSAFLAGQLRPRDYDTPAHLQNTLHSTSSHPPRHISKMSAIARRAAFTAVRAPVRVAYRKASGVNSGSDGVQEERKQDASAVKKGAKKDPELFVRLKHP